MVAKRHNSFPIFNRVRILPFIKAYAEQHGELPDNASGNHVHHLLSRSSARSTHRAASTSISSKSNSSFSLSISQLPKELIDSAILYLVMFLIHNEHLQTPRQMLASHQKLRSYWHSIIRPTGRVLTHKEIVPMTKDKEVKKLTPRVRTLLELLAKIRLRIRKPEKPEKNNEN
jgi:hypothetical protein